ncbi:MAG: YvcK family protein, partial [Armatimonadetes bacterium]|nr:YvcK family protein [Armatimonadota bacterium]
MKVKRWAALTCLGLVLVGAGVLLVANLFAYELTARVGGPLAASLWGTLAILAGLVAIGAGVRGIVASIASALAPYSPDRLADVVWRQRRREAGLRVVAIGGGTGLSALLRGLKHHTTNLCAIVTITDEGGSSGRLRRDLGVPPPGDIRNCLAALADAEDLMARLLQYRFDGTSGELSGHSLGNLLIAALTQVTGNFDEA